MAYNIVVLVLEKLLDLEAMFMVNRCHTGSVAFVQGLSTASTSHHGLMKIRTRVTQYNQSHPIEATRLKILKSSI